MIDYKLDWILSYSATLSGSPEIIGPVPEGIRVNFYVTGGEVHGNRIRGKVRPVGGDWGDNPTGRNAHPRCARHL